MAVVREPIGKLRRWISYAFYAGLIFIFILDIFLIHFSFYVYVVVLLAYVFGLQELLSRLFGSSSGDRIYSFPFPIDAVAEAVPRVFQRRLKGSYSDHVYGVIINADPTSGNFMAKIGWSRWSMKMTVNLEKLDERTTKIHVLCEQQNQFADWGANRKMIEKFLTVLYRSIDKPKSNTHTRP